MKRVVLILGVTATAALAVVPSLASAGNAPQKAKRVPAFEQSLQISQDDRSGQTVYRLGNTGLWMQ